MRAILLAAGMGTRLRPLTLETPKSLIKVNGKPMIEKQIEYLREIGVEDIVILTGYLEEKFHYLKDKYGVSLVHNPKYNIYNNIYTMYLVRDYLSDAYVIDADVYLHRNFFEKHINKSTYFSALKKDFKGEWIIKFNEDNRIYDIEVGDDEGYILCGVSYWSDKDGIIIREKLEKSIEEEDFSNLYWDDIVKDNIKDLEVYIHKIEDRDSYEIDSLEDLRKVENLIKNKLI
ncbi:sugar phosphate nucleotidyltransferase [Clostridium sp.]|uniref:sugar phosphate nucleotidyltransferase n=1 Tax=Clostridium sp. TaxID=1506 RepID=UPI003464402C